MIIQSNGANKLHLKANMRTEDGLDGMKIDESGNVHPIHLRDNQSEDPSFEAQKPWKKNYVISSSDKTTEEHQAPKQISTGGRIALIFALAVALALTALVVVYLVLRNRHGPRYTVRSFFHGLRPERDRSRESKSSTVPMFIATELPPTKDVPKRVSTKLKKPMQQNSGRRFSTEHKSSMMAGSVFASGGTQSRSQPQPIREPDPVRYGTRQSAGPTAMSRLSTPSVTTWSSFLYLYPSTSPPPPPPQQQQQQQQQQEHDNYNPNPNSNNGIATTSRRKQPPPPLGPVSPYAHTGVENQRALAPGSPCSARTQITTTTQSSGPIPSVYKLWIGRDASRASTTTPSGYGDCRWSYCQDHRNDRAGHSIVGSEDRVVSLPSPSPMLRNMIRPRGAPPPVNNHVYQMMRQSPNGEQQHQARGHRQSHFWEIDSYHDLQESEVPRSSRYGMTGGPVDDNGLPMLPRSIFAPNT